LWEGASQVAAPTAARHRLACLEPIAAAKLSDRQRFLLVNCVETYVQLDHEAREEYEALLAEKGNEEVATMEMTWADRLRQEGFEVGIREGIEEGKEEGRQEGKQVGMQEGKRALLLELLDRRFGPLPEATVKRVRALTSSEELSRLAARVLEAPSLDDLGL
jgi:flagellar biosynthesis/type III secretory pathway protein FliH